jgi:2-polyprenyl-6-methoxyphenol hydroxylase-like FAD-dependent oxidoreductase
MKGRRMDVVVAGGGIAGLAAGAAIARAGIDVTILERAPFLGAVGSGLVLAPNGMAALDAIDPALGASVRAAGWVAAPGQARPWLGPGGDVLSTDPIGELEARWGTPQVSLRRAALQAALLDAARTAGATIRTGATVTSHADHGSHVEIRLDDGTCLSAKALLGADGVRSAVRARLLADGPPRYCGYTSVRGEARAPRGLPHGFVATDGGTHLFAAAVGPGQLYWAAKFDAHQGEWPAKADARAALLDLLAGWDERIVDMVRAPGPIVVSDVLDRDPVPQWTHGRVTLLGDAAHPMSPAVGQGASLAVEDAVVLAKCLRDHDDVTEALAEYSAVRAPRAAAVVGLSRQGRTVVARAGNEDRFAELYAWRPAA